MSAISSSSTAQSLGLQIKNSKNKKAKRATRFWNENTVIERHKYQTISYTLSNIKKYSFFQKVYKEAILKLQRIQSQFESYETKIFLNIPTFSLSPTQKLNYIWKSNSPSRKQMNLNKKNKSQHGGYLLILQYQREEEVFIDQYNTSNPSSLIRSQDNHLKNDDIILDQAKDSYNSLLCKINYNSQEKNNIKITNITKRQNTFCYIFQIKKWILLDQKVCAMLIQYQIKRNFLTFSTFSQKDIQKIQSTPQQQDMKISQQEYFNFNANIINMIEKGVKIFKKERINTNLKEEEKKVSYSYQSNLNLLQQLNQQQLQNYKKNSQTYEISTNLKIKPQNSHTLATLFTKIPNLQNDSKEERNYKQNGMFQAEMIQIKSGIQQKQKTNIHQEYLKIISSVIDDAQIGDYNIKFTSKDDIHSKLSQIKRQNVLNLLRRYKKEDQKKLQSKYLLSKSSISLNNHGYQKYQKKNNKSFTSCGRLLGGGSGMSIGCCSNQNIINQDQIANDIDLIDDVQVIKDSKVDEKFIKNYNKYIVSTQRKKKEVINKSLQSVEIINILNNCLDKFKDQIPPNLQSYRLYVFEIFDLILQYSFSLSNYEQNDEDNICDQIDLILEKLKKCTELHPCQDITFMLQFLYDMNFSKFRNTEAEVNHRQAIENLSQLLISNQLNIGSVTDSQKSFSKILQEGREHIKQIKLRAASKEKLTDGNIWRVVDDIHQQFHSAPKDIIAQQMSYVWSLRIEYLEELEKKGKENIQVEDEILFYINQFMELSQRDTTYSQILLYVITTIHYLFEKKGLTNYFSTEAAKSLAKKLPISNSNIKNFICMLQQNRFSQQQSKNFFKFMVKDKTYRFISNQILLKYLLILSQQQEISDTIKEDFWVHLCYTYVTEKNQSVKTIFQNDSSFIRSINQKKQERGNQIFSQATTNNRDKTIQQQISTYQKSQHYSEKKEEDIQGGKKNSLEEIAENFLNHQRKQEGQNIIAAVEKGVQDDKKQNCCILGILADGEKLSESDACIYFSKYDDNGKRDESSYCIVQLQEFERKDVDEYCSRFFKKSRTNNQQLDQNQYDRDISAMEKFLKNSKLENLLLLPINLYLFTRMLVTKEESEVSKLANNISDQIQIQEIFFQEQFIHETKNFIYEVKCQDNKELQLRVASAYFEYFQQIAINMLINKGKSIRNFLQLNKAEINFELQDSLKKILSKKQQNTLKDKIINYVNSKIVTRLKEEEQFQIVDHENQQYQDGKQRNEDTSYIKNFVEFRHKSLFEYFAARAMKFDFEIHQENIYKLPIEQLQRFSINKELIMSPGYNKSEQQILLKLSKLIELDLQSGLVDYTQNYSCNRIEDTNRYIQYIRSARIENSEEISPIDKGASNILSALFVSRFAYDNLTLTQCSLSKAYLINKANKNIVFERCNLSDALLRKIDISSVETSNTLQATFDVYPNVFDTDSIQGFNQIIFSQVDVLMSINELGYVNSYRINKDKKKLTMLKQKKITNTPLKQIVYYGQDNKFVISGNQAIFLIDCNDLKIISTKRFNSKIKNIDCQRKKCLIQLENETSFYGNFDEEGFQEIQLKGTNAKLSPQNCELIITQNEKEMIIYEVKENQFNMINTINTGKICSAAFSVDGKYLATGSDDNNCKIWNVGKGFQLMNTIEGHTGKINSVAFSADGKYLATCSDDKTCKIMNAEKGYELMNTIQEHTGLINSVAFSLDGKYLATGSDDKTCKIWSAEKGFELMNTFEGHTSKINSVAFSAYGKYLATCSDDKTCKIWNAEKGFELMNTIEAHTHQINSVAFSADGKYLATVSSDMTCKIWNAEKKFELMNTIQGHTGKINSVAFSADGKYLATCSDDKTCKIRNAEKEFELISTIEGNTDNISQVAFSANGKYLATFSASPHDYTCKIWNAQKGFELMNKIEGHNNQIRQVAFSADGKYLATVSYDNTCKIWNAEKGFKLMNTIEEQVYFMRSVAFSADGKYLATGWDDSTCKIWNAEKGFELINTIKNHNGAINSIAFSADGKYLATGSDDKTCKVWNAEKGFELTNTIEGHKHWISSVAFSADGKYQATGSYDNTCKIWNAENGFELMNTIEGHTFWINSVAFSADGKYLATGSLDKTCKIWNVQKGFELMNTIEGHIEKINSLSFSADGKYLAIGSDDKTCKIWNSEKGFELMNIIKEHTDKINSVTFSANGKYLATGSDDKTCKIWNAEKGFELINTIEGHSDKINSVAFSADGKYLATCSDDKTCKIWNAEKGFELMNTIEGNTHRINSVAFSADGKYLATSSGTNDFTCKILNAEKEFELIYTIEGHTSWIISVAFSANGKYLATGSFDKTCRIWNAEKGKKQKKIFQCQYIL
ncbi:hypothetical protein ABPG73_022215 [Tetrahymena malaccensis]